MALEYTDWIKLAEDKNLLLTEDQFKELKEGQTYAAAQVDYLRFLAIEWAEKHNIELDTVYSAEDLFSRVKSHITPDGVMEEKPGYVVAENCCNVEEKPVRYYPIILDLIEVSGPFESSLYALQKSPILMSGNGDGWTRWMLWDDVIQMPDLYLDSRRSD